MTEGDKAYMKALRHKAEPIEEPTHTDTYWYFLGSSIGFVFWIWFIVWFMGSAS